MQTVTVQRPSSQPYPNHAQFPLPATLRLPIATHGSLIIFDSSLTLGDEAHFGLETGYYNIGLGDEIVI